LMRYLNVLDRLIIDVDDAGALQELRQRLSPNKASPFETLVGTALRTSFEKHFAIEAGYTKNPVDGEITGTYIDFAEAVLKELKTPGTRQIIVEALSRYRGKKKNLPARATLS